MLYNNAGELLQILRKENLYTEKKLGQNFLINPHIIDLIIKAADIGPTDHIVEVGPGLGILTGELVKTAKAVTTIEMDDKLIPFLKKQFHTQKKLTIVHQDVLRTECPRAPYKVVANIPYYITSPIITHFLHNVREHQPQLMVLMTQLEVARKIMADSGDHSILSLHTQVFAKPRLVHQVSAGNFFPAPKVDSAILTLESLPSPQITDIYNFFKLTKQAFQQKRKTLINSLQSFKGLNKPLLESALKNSNLNVMIRPQQLNFEDWQKLMNNLPLESPTD